MFKKSDETGDMIRCKKNKCEVVVETDMVTLAFVDGMMYTVYLKEGINEFRVEKHICVSDGYEYVCVFSR